jgi:hypothetical protein
MFRLTAAVAAIALCASACSQSSGDSAAGPSSASRDTSATDSSTTLEVTTDPPPESTAITVAPTDTFGRTKAKVDGTAVGGNNGDEDRGIRYSEAIRNSDGSCKGWDDPDSPVRTAGLENGAPVQILDDNNQVIGSGRIESSKWFDAADGLDNWTCVFSYTATIDGAVPDSFRIKVADLPPWGAAPDPTNPGAFVSSVDSEASPDLISECTDLANFTQAPDPTSPQDSTAGATDTTIGATTDTTGTTEELPFQEWQPVVRTYWSDAVSNLCAQGFTVTVKRDCRPSGVGSDYAIKVLRADDPTIVLEEVDEVHQAAGRIPPGVGVIVVVATGRPC